MKITVERENCDANGVCVLLAPQLFELDDAEELTVLDDEPDRALWGAASAAARGCPKLAITLRGLT